MKSSSTTADGLTASMACTRKPFRPTPWPTRRLNEPRGSKLSLEKRRASYTRIKTAIGMMKFPPAVIGRRRALRIKRAGVIVDPICAWLVNSPTLPPRFPAAALSSLPGPRRNRHTCAGRGRLTALTPRTHHIHRGAYDPRRRFSDQAYGVRIDRSDVSMGSAGNGSRGTDDGKKRLRSEGNDGQARSRR